MGGDLAVSRSIHETRRELEEVRRWEFGGRDDEVWLVGDRLAAKRRYSGGMDDRRPPRGGDDAPERAADHAGRGGCRHC